MNELISWIHWEGEINNMFERIWEVERLDVRWNQVRRRHIWSGRPWNLRDNTKINKANVHPMAHNHRIGPATPKEAHWANENKRHTLRILIILWRSTTPQFSFPLSSPNPRSVRETHAHTLSLSRAPISAPPPSLSPTTPTPSSSPWSVFLFILSPFRLPICSNASTTESANFDFYFFSAVEFSELDSYLIWLFNLNVSLFLCFFVKKYKIVSCSDLISVFLLIFFSSNW